MKIKAMTEEVRTMYSSHGSYHKGDSGLDVFVITEQTIKAGETALIKLGIKVSAWTRCDGVMSQAKTATGEVVTACDGVAPERWNASFLIMPRSSISKTPLRLCNSIGLVDAGYRGELMLAVDNVKTYDHTVKVGDRLVQLVGFTGGDVSFEMVDELDDTSRGEGGFGSTTQNAHEGLAKDVLLKEGEDGHHKVVDTDGSASARKKRCIEEVQGDENKLANVSVTDDVVNVDVKEVQVQNQSELPQPVDV